MVRKSKLITELSKEEIIEICVKCFDYKPEHIVSLRRYNKRPPHWRVTEIETGVKKVFWVIDPFDYDETILNSGLTPEQWRKFKTYCFEKGVCCKLYWEPNWKPEWYKEMGKLNESAREFKFKKKPTEKQMDLIREIEEYCGVDFNGETRDEASDFIDEWIMELQDRKADERNFFRDN